MNGSFTNSFYILYTYIINYLKEKIIIYHWYNSINLYYYIIYLNIFIFI